MEFLQAFGTAFGILAGSGVLALFFKVGMSWGSVSRAVARTDTAVNDPEHGLVPRVQRVEQTLHGPQGDNGLYSDVKELKRRLEDDPAIPKRRVTDKRRKAS